MNLRQLIQEQNADQEMHDDTMRREALKFDLGDFSFEPDGSINILLTNYDLATPIYMFKVFDQEAIIIFFIIKVVVC